MLLYLIIKNSSESNGDGRLSNTNVGQRKFILNRSGVLAPCRSHPVGGPYHRPPTRLVLVEIGGEIFFWSFWSRERVFFSMGISSWLTQMQTWRQINWTTSPPKQTKRLTLQGFPDSMLRPPPSPQHSCLYLYDYVLITDCALFKYLLCDIYELLLLLCTSIPWFIFKKKSDHKCSPVQYPSVDSHWLEDTIEIFFWPVRPDVIWFLLTHQFTPMSPPSLILSSPTGFFFLLGIV